VNLLDAQSLATAHAVAVVASCPAWSPHARIEPLASSTTIATRLRAAESSRPARRRSPHHHEFAPHDLVPHPYASTGTTKCP
jgi:hypothetical protein